MTTRETFQKDYQTVRTIIANIINHEQTNTNNTFAMFRVYTTALEELTNNGMSENRAMFNINIWRNASNHSNC